MRKLLSLFTALLFAASILAGDVVFTASDFAGKGALSPGKKMSVEKQGITVSVDLGYGSGTDIRVFAGSTLSISADVNMTKVILEFTQNNKYEGKNAGETLTWQPNATQWSISATKQMRLSKITVTVDKETEQEADPVNLGVKTLAEFIELANTKDTCIITGVAKNITSTQFANFYITDGDAKVKIYGLKDAEGNNASFADFGIENGDTLTVKATYTLYQGEPEAAYPHFVSLAKGPKEPVEVTDTIQIEALSGVWFEDATDTEGWFQIIAETEDFYISLCAYSSELAGTYDVEDEVFDEDYTGLDLYTESASTSVTFVSGSIRLTVGEDGSVDAKGILIGDDNKAYDIHLVFVEPKADTSVELNFESGKLIDETADSYTFTVSAVSSDAISQFGIVVYSDQVVGEFDDNDLDPNDSYIYADGEIQSIYTASFTVTANQGGSYLLSGDFLCYNNALYKVTVTISAAQGITNANANAKAVKAIVNGQLLITRDGKTFNVLGTVVK